MPKTAIIVGAGIAGLATARALATRGYKVTVVERTYKAIGASIRNFGMIWPVGQPDGELYEQAMLSRRIWKEVCDDAGIWYDEAGSLHLAYQPDEWQVLHELAGLYSHRGYQLWEAGKTKNKSANIVTDNLLGSLFSPDEMIVDPRLAISGIARWLTEKWGVDFLWGRAVTAVAFPAVYSGVEEWKADEIYICSGADFETLYPELYAENDITKCKLQMMRMAAQTERIGPALCGALSLIHYQSFKIAGSIHLLRKRFENEYPGYLKWGIHVMVSQNQAGELTIGDSHEYGLTHDPFDREFINQLIKDYLRKFARFSNEKIIESWNGIYPKLINNKTHLMLEPEPGVTLINGLGGAGMTLAFGLCEQLVAKKSGVRI